MTAGAPSRSVLVTGGTGLIGRVLVPVLHAAGWEVHATARSAERARSLPPEVVAHVTGDLRDFSGWAELVADRDAVVHLAAPADLAAPELGPYLEHHLVVTQRAFEAVQAHGGIDFLCMSSAKAVAEESEPGRPINEASQPRPTTFYGESKLRTEREILAVDEGAGRTTFLRCPLVYGPGVRGNFRRLLQVAGAGLPLPLASVGNRRSWLFSENLAAAICAVLEAPEKPGGIYLVDDGPPLSTGEVLTKMARAQGRPSRLFRFPLGGFLGLAGWVGLGGVLGRVLGSFETDATRFRTMFAWSPPYTMEEGLRRTLAADERPT